MVVIEPGSVLKAFLLKAWGPCFSLVRRGYPISTERSELGSGKGVISRANPQRQVPSLASCSSANSFSPKLRLFKKKNIYIYIYFLYIYIFGYAVSLLWNVRSSSLTRDGIQALGAGTLSPWTTREVLLYLLLKAVLPVPL